MKIPCFQVVLLLAASCASSSALSEIGVYKGAYFYNFENSVLTPRGTAERWCVDGDMSKAMLPAKSTTGPWGTAEVEIRGDLGPVGRYGGLGACSRVLTVLEVISVKNKKSSR